MDEVTSIDWTVNCSHIRFTTSNYDVQYWMLDRRCEEVRRSIVRDLQFTEQSGTLSYSTAGVWNENEKDLLFTTASRSHNKNLLCTGNNQGSIRLYYYPCDTFGVSIQIVYITLKHTCCVSFSFLISFLLLT